MSCVLMLWYLDEGGVENLEQWAGAGGMHCCAMDLKSDIERILEAYLLLSFTAM